MPLHFHRSQAYGRSQRTARIEFSYSASVLAFRLFPYGLSVTSGPIRETFAHDSFQCPLGSLYIIHTQPHAVAVAKIEFRQIAVQVLLAAMLVDALHTS